MGSIKVFEDVEKETRLHLGESGVNSMLAWEMSLVLVVSDFGEV